MYKKKIIIFFLLISLMAFNETVFTKSKESWITIRINWYTNVEDAGLLLRYSDGTFLKNGIGVKIVPYNEKSNACDSVIENEVNIGIEDTVLFAKCREKNPELVAIAAKFQINPIAINVIDKDLNKLEDLKNKIVSTARGYSFYTDIFKILIKF